MGRVVFWLMARLYKLNVLDYVVYRRRLTAARVIVRLQTPAYVTF